MKKVDDSLRKLKKARQGFSLFGSNKQTGESAAADEDKVKVQMQTDVEALIMDAATLGTSVESSKALLSLREAAMK